MTTPDVNAESPPLSREELTRIGAVELEAALHRIEQPFELQRRVGGQFERNWQERVAAVERAAREATPGIRDDGRAKVLAGTTSLEELLRVTREE